MGRQWPTKLERWQQERLALNLLHASRIGSSVPRSELAEAKREVSDLIKRRGCRYPK
jgi:hypothetical protein